jgi:hypothetical protein
MAVIGMAYGKEAKNRPVNEDYDIGQDMFYLAYMTSIMVVPVTTTILQLQLKNKVQLNPFTQPPLTRELTIWRRAKLPRSNSLYVFNLFTDPWGRMRVERWLGLLDLVVWIHGAIGLIYALILDETTTYSL